MTSPGETLIQSVPNTEILAQAEQTRIGLRNRTWQYVGRVAARTALSLGLAVGGGVGGEMATIQPSAASADTGGYGYADAIDCSAQFGIYSWCKDENGDKKFSSGEQNSPLGYDYRNCTDWVASRIPQLGVGSVPTGLGNGAQWNDNAPNTWVKDSIPEPGDIAQSETTAPFGHVGVVESVSKNQEGVISSIEVSQYNKSGDGNYDLDPYTPDASGVFWRDSNHTKKWDNFIDLNGTGKGINGEDLTGGGETSTPSTDITHAVIQRPSGETNLVVVAPDKTLDFYVNAAGSGAWGKMDIKGATWDSDAKSTPVMVQRPSGETDIAAQGADGSLDFYYNAQGSPTWGKIEIAGPNTAHSAPAMIQRPNGETDIVVQGPDNSLDFYMNNEGSPVWQKITIPDAAAHGRPAIVQRSTGETNIAVQGPNNSMYFYYNAQGSPTWGKSGVAVGGWALSAPAMVQRPWGETDIIVEGPGHSLDMYMNAQGSLGWDRMNIRGGNTTYNAPHPPAVVERGTGETNVVVQGPGNQADFYYNALGSSNWYTTPIAVGGDSLKAPVMVQRSTTGETDVVVTGPGRRLDFYVNAQGSPGWGRLEIAGGEAVW